MILRLIKFLAKSYLLFTACLKCFCIFIIYIPLRGLIWVSQCHLSVSMPINIDQWHVTTSLFYGKVYAVIPNSKNSYDCNVETLIFLLFFYSIIVFLILLVDGDIESNPGPKTKTKKTNFFMLPLECQ